MTLEPGKVELEAALILVGALPAERTLTDLCLVPMYRNVHLQIFTQFFRQLLKKLVTENPITNPNVLCYL
ncbi:MAG: hypothetical protein JWQ40_1280 [Segetibacter sp.]|nr:hypothetical protein [Segetibacter sp.]